MNKLGIAFSLSLFICSIQMFAQSIKLGKYELTANQVSISEERVKGKRAIKVIKDTSVKAVDEPTFARVNGVNFINGTIEVKVLSRLLPTAPPFARGFIGISFRINDSNAKYESIYIRPTNGRADDQVRRNHSIQYYSYPDFKFDRLRLEAPERYESYADMTLDQWITMRIELNGAVAKLFLNGNRQPSLIVKDLKHGDNASGGIALWVEVGTEGYFANLKINKKE